MKTYKNLVGGKLVGSVEGQDESIISPVDEGVLGKVPLGGEKDVDRAVSAAAAAFETWQETTPADRSLLLLRLADVIEKNARGARRPGVPERRQADRPRALRGPVHGRQPSVLRRRRALHGGQGGGRIPGGLHQHDPARARGRRGLDRAVELPADDGGLEDGPGARDRQHGRPEALRANAPDDAAARGARAGPLPARRLQRDHRARRAGRRGPRPASSGQHGLADGRRRDRQGGREGGLGLAQEGPPRARRQGAGHRVRRRRHGPRRSPGSRWPASPTAARTAPPRRACTSARGPTTRCSVRSSPRSSRSSSGTSRTRTRTWGP